MRQQVLLVVLMAAATIFVGCGSDDKLGAEAYGYGTALYSVCNQQDQDRLANLLEKIEADRAASALTTAEADHLAGIVETAQAGEWREATQAARRLLEAQVGGR